MTESKTDESFLNDCWMGLTSWEEEVCDDIENKDEAINQILLNETEGTNKKLWTSFQNAAQCVAIMYKGTVDSQDHSLWTPFQTAAGNVTSLYKDSSECMKKCTELGSQSGYHKRTKELANWARRKRHFRREELLAFLSGKSPPHRTSHYRGSPRSRLSLDRMSPRLPSTHHHHHQAHSHEDNNLTIFREALGIHGPPAVVSSSNLSSRRRGSNHSPMELQSFMCDEFARHKRPAPSSSPHEVTMDSPQHKRVKFA